MKREAVNPASMYDTLKYNFSHAVESEGRHLLHLAGQVAVDAEGNLVGEGDLALQTRKVCKNLKEVLASRNAGPENVVRIRIYVVDHEPSKLEIIEPVIGEFFGEVAPAASTLIGVQALALPGFLIEIEATAVLD
jgi:enamine deaminase RidA (YjgF/YER057c/UK114 family)